jgi:hypothetical protein
MQYIGRAAEAAGLGDLYEQLQLRPAIHGVSSPLAARRGIFVPRKTHLRRGYFAKYESLLE